VCSASGTRVSGLLTQSSWAPIALLDTSAEKGAEKGGAPPAAADSAPAGRSDREGASKGDGTRLKHPTQLAAQEAGAGAGVRGAAAGGEVTFACALCRRSFKSQHAVEIHLSRNDACRRRKGALHGSALASSSQRLLGA